MAGNLRLQQMSFTIPNNSQQPLHLLRTQFKDSGKPAPILSVSQLFVMPRQVEDFSQATGNVEVTDSDDNTDTDRCLETTNSDDDLREICVAIVPQPANMTPQELLQTALLEAQKSKGHQGKKAVSAGHLMEAKLNQAPEEDEDGLKTELFQFVPTNDDALMGHKNFGDVFTAGVNGSHSEMTSNIKSYAAIFGLHSEYWQGISLTYAIRVLGASHQHPWKLYQILKTALFGKSLVSSSITSAGPRTKSKIWELQDTSPDMVAAAAVVMSGSLVIFLLLGDREFQQKGNKTGILYNQYHNYYYSSSSAFEPTAPFNVLEDVDYEEAFKCAMEMGLPQPVIPNTSSLPLSSTSTSAATPVTVTAPPNLDCISAAIQLEHLNLGNPPVLNDVVVPVPAPEPALAAAATDLASEVLLEVPVSKPKSKPAGRHKDKATDGGIVDAGLDGTDE
ncbi:hypothetical protein BS17DRAFT_766875 [Gyrodon lividus]|nr:hypothetical protein BS17DRAFT_766875 [Gyrodon lividus]